jgi:hypothetical protein
LALDLAASQIGPSFWFKSPVLSGSFQAPSTAPFAKIALAQILVGDIAKFVLAQIPVGDIAKIVLSQILVGDIA